MPKWIRFAFAGVFIWFSLVYPFGVLIGSVPDLLKGREFFSLLFSNDVLNLAWITFQVAFMALAITFGIAFAITAILYRTHVPWIRALFETTWIIPGLMMALIVLGAQKKMGIVDRYGFHSIIIAWVLMGVPYLTLGWLRAIDDIDDREVELYRTLGASRFKTFKSLIIPKTFPMVQSLLVHQFYWYLVSFSLVGVLGGGPPNETLEVAIYTAVNYDRIRVVEALCYAIWQIFLLGAVRAILGAISNRAHLGKKDLFTEEWNSMGIHTHRSQSLRVVVYLLSLTSFFIILFNPETFEPVIQGAALATASAGLSVGLSIALLLLRLDALAKGLAWISPMIFALAWWKAYALNINRGPDREWLLASLVVGVQALLFLPWAIRFLGPIYRRIRIREIEAFQSMGGKPLQAWIKIEWPRVWNDTRFLFSVVWSFALGEVSTVILFSKGGFEPLGVWIQNQLVRFRIHEAWMGTLLLVFLSVIMIQSRSRRRRRR